VRGAWLALNQIVETFYEICLIVAVHSVRNVFPATLTLAENNCLHVSELFVLFCGNQTRLANKLRYFCGFMTKAGGSCGVSFVSFWHQGRSSPVHFHSKYAMAI